MLVFVSKVVQEVNMRSTDEVKELFAAYNGILRTDDLHRAKIYYKDIQALISEGAIEKVRYGYYQLVDSENPSEALTITRLFPDAILCMDTALFYYRYSDRTPFFWHLAVSKDSVKSRFKIDYPFVKPYYIEPSVLSVGIATGEIDGNPVKIYDKERTICDCLRSVGKMDRELFNKAIRSYLEDPEKDVPLLLDYAARLRVTKKVKNLIGVWL
jgi:predicted transcriptional regulator of viral defense system